MKHHLAQFSAIALITFSHAALADSPSEGTDGSRVHQFAQFAERFNILPHGNPLRHKRKAVSDPYFPKQGGVAHEVYFNGFYYTYYHSNHYNKNYLTSLFVGSSKIDLPFGLRVGCTQQDILDKLGTPTSKIDTEIQYDDGDPFIASNEIHFYFHGKILKYIVWYPYVD